MRQWPSDLEGSFLFWLLGLRFVEEFRLKSERSCLGPDLGMLVDGWTCKGIAKRGANDDTTLPWLLLLPGGPGDVNE